MWPVGNFTTAIRAGEMIRDPPYQRGDVWSDQQRVDLMRSFLQGVPIPAIVLNDRTGWPATQRALYAVIDGRQRLTTILDWLDGRLPIPASWLPPQWLHTTEDTDDGPYVRTTGLHQPRQVQARMSLPCVVARLDSLAAEAGLYLRLNGAGTPHTTADLARAAHTTTARRDTST